MTDHLTITRAMLTAALRDNRLTMAGAGQDIPVWDALARRAQARPPSRVRWPWQDELNRLRWLEEQVTGLAGEMREDARALREDVSPAADAQTRDSLGARAAELDSAAEAIEAMLGASHAGDPSAQPSSRQWAQWHLDQLTRHLGVLHAAGNGDGQ